VIFSLQTNLKTMSQYNNVNEFLATIGFSMPMTPEEYKAEKKV